VQLIFYAPPGHRARTVAEAFVAGCRGRLAADRRVLEPYGPWGFYGVKPDTAAAFADASRSAKLDAARDPRRSYIYVDNGYILGRDHFRATWGAEQLTYWAGSPTSQAPAGSPIPGSGPGTVPFSLGRPCGETAGLAGAPPDMTRLAALGIAVRDWRRAGELGDAVLIALQSPYWYLRHDTTLGAWFDTTLAEIRRVTDRPVLVRCKARFAAETWVALGAEAIRVRADQPADVAADLARAWCVVTHSSAVAVDAILAGIPAFVTHPCAASMMASGKLADIEAPGCMHGVQHWAAWLAANQWTLDEMRRGKCWADLTRNEGNRWLE
jgi:hypothetical protein